MQEPQEKQQRAKGPIERMFDWVFALIIVVILVGIAWRFAIYPLFFTEMEPKAHGIQTIQIERV